MREVIVNAWMSLDGVIQSLSDPLDSLDWLIHTFRLTAGQGG